MLTISGGCIVVHSNMSDGRNRRLGLELRRLGIASAFTAAGLLEELAASSQSRLARKVRLGSPVTVASDTSVTWRGKSFLEVHSRNDAVCRDVAPRQSPASQIG